MASIPGPLAGFGRGANLPYFAKQGDYRAHSPQEQKRRVLRSFPVLTGISERQKEPKMGLFSLMSVIMVFYFQRKRNKNQTTKKAKKLEITSIYPFFQSVT